MLIYNLTYEELVEFLSKNGHKKFRADQIWNWLYKQKVATFREMTNLPEELLVLLEETYKIQALELVLKHTSTDGTIKALYSLHDGHLIESVLMQHHYGNSICVTTQVGCNIGCSFCASGLLKKKRDLTAGEIIAQIIETERILKERIAYVVVMGIGEPFDNYEQLMRFLTTVNHPKGLEIGARHITVSTSGIVPKIKEYAHMGLQVNLAISLHAPNNEIRTKLMKINQRYPVEEVIGAIKYYLSVANRRVTIEYILIDGINDMPEVAEELSRVLRGLNVYVNLIPYNEVLEAPYKRSASQTMNTFYDILSKNKIQVTLRKEQGHDINAACGQLRSQHL
ncbi:MAG TPA: 23S rRNA (adenine(2503)-C(2))-methyltransferase RlmN [Acholeplasmataceae bacterium]|nr:MAG: 23S rRNA (adenine(2503)-C(2))-methyltransferase [Tenericutes bacterium GWA2_38_26]OHE30988.1 MAG: 23S rRNA (adenine(2503)-C(2))-methyltransferase [Tenericutes bacterium GWC2_39_45]OHE32842.1 MAG: 23S rRNA (adenine(2503)-C(2))-methyltransferase [Tenericutes bacterium GWD2_38_27]OHE38393.1 MAG: 23S rRNA (adenine(2503)-C(2))-methyltransferase [Tenericutes bacterium GWE2_38_8]OHE41259.1 MAG: 23S rRNA (adenine(2503)-C(2))-methyltransferase [Tenericutes bacterium GWF2_38_8]HBG32282.1 23S rRN